MPPGALVGQHVWMRGTLARSSVPGVRVTPGHGVCTGQTGKNLKNRDNPQPTRLPAPSDVLGVSLGGSTLAKMWVCPLPGGTLKVRATPTREGATAYRPHRAAKQSVQNPPWSAGSTELACGSQAFIATLLFDPSMSALPIIPKQNSVSVGLFTH